jgi:tRNA (cmo5U34)-methyltransferase
LLGVDIEPGMVQVAQRKSADFANVQITLADLIDLGFEPADLIVAYYTVQFVRPEGALVATTSGLSPGPNGMPAAQ